MHSSNTPAHHETAAIASDPEIWRYSVGAKPHTVSAYERPERDGEVWLRWSNPTKPGRDKREYRNLKVKVRPTPSAPVDARQVLIVEQAVHDLHAELVRGRTLTLVVPSGVQPIARTVTVPEPEQPPAPARQETSAAASSATPGVLTLRAGFALALAVPDGKYSSTKSRRYIEMLAMSKRLFGESGEERRLIDPELAWDAFDAQALRALRREMAKRYLASKGEQFGMRIAEVLIDAIYSVAAFLREDGRIPLTVCRRPDKWRQQLRIAWTEETGQRVKKGSKPRHTRTEYRQIFCALEDERADPRICLAIELAAEMRTGQVLTCTRTTLTLPDIDPALYDSMPAGTLGTIEIVGAGKKRGELVMFTPEQRRAVDRALAGYLSRYETAYRAGLVTDYPLFPGGKMHGKRDDPRPRKPFKVKPNVKPINRTGARHAFHELERIAGVDVIEGRAWYGLRRVGSDLAEDYTTDERVQNALGAWADSDTRRRIYQDRESQAVRAKAADVRRRMRVGKGMAVPSDDATASAEEPATQTPEQRILARNAARPAPARPTPDARPTLPADRAPIPGTTGTTRVVPGVGPQNALPGTTRSQAGRSDAATTSCKVGATGFEPATSCSRTGSCLL
jgi:hypothetical protein